MQIGLHAVHANAGDDPAGRDDVLANLKGRRNTNSLDRGIDTLAAGDCPDLFGGFSVRAVDRLCRAEAPCDLNPIYIQIDHDDFGRCIKLRGEQGG
jgi:hypothetical protein